MTIAGAKLFSNFSVNVPVASTSASARSISVQRHHSLPQVSTKAAQSLRFSVVKELRRRYPYCANESQVAQCMWDFGASRPLNSPTNALHPHFFFYRPIVPSSKWKSSLNFMVVNSEEAAIIDIEEKADGSILFKFMPKEQLLAVENFIYFLLRGTEGDSSDLLNELITKNSDQFCLQRLRDGRAFHRFYNGNVKCTLSSCKFDNEEANDSMLKQSGSLVPGEHSFGRVFIVSNSSVSIVKFSAEGLLFFLEGITGQSFLASSIDSSYAQHEMNKGDGRDTSLISSDFTNEDQQLECLPRTSSSKEITTSSMSKTVATKMPLHSLAWPENVSDCEAVVAIPVVFKVAFDFDGIRSQANTMPLNMRENIIVMPFPNNEKELKKEDFSPNLAAATKITNKDSLETFSTCLVSSRRHGRKNLGLKEKQVKHAYQLRATPTNGNHALRRPLKKSGGENVARFKETMRKSATNPRDLFSRSRFQVFELLLTYRFTNINFGDFEYKSVKKACLEIADVLNQLSVGLAGSGLAIILFIASQMLKLNSAFDNGKFAALLRGFCFIWLSTAIQNVRTLIIKFSKGSSMPAKEQARRLHREMKNLSVKALTVTALSLVGCVNYF